MGDTMPPALRSVETTAVAHAAQIGSGGAREIVALLRCQPL